MTQLSLPITTLWGRLFGQKNKPDAVSTAISRASKRLIEASQASPDEALQMLETTAAGLPTAEAADRLERYGLNEVAHEKVPAWHLQLLLAFANPFVAVLMTLAIV